MKKLLILLMLVPTSGVLLLISKADAANDESEIQQLLDKWSKAARAHDVNSVMSIYAPEVIAYDIVPPLRFVATCLPHQPISGISTSMPARVRPRVILR